MAEKEEKVIDERKAWRDAERVYATRNDEEAGQ